MALTTEQQDSILKLTFSLFRATPGAVYLNALAPQVEAGVPMASLAQSLAKTSFFFIKPGTGTLSGLSAQAFAESLVDRLVDRNLSDADRAAAVAFIADRMTTTGASQEQMIAEVAEILHAIPLSDPTWGKTALKFHQDNVTRVVGNLLGSFVVTDEDRALAEDLLLAEITSGKSFGEVVEWAYTILDSIDHADPVWGAAAARFDHMIEVSRYYTVERGGTSTSLNRLGLIMVPVTEDAESVDEAKAAIDDLLDNPAVRDVLSLDGSDGFRLLIDGGFQLSSYDAVGDINGDGFMDLALRLSTNHYFLLGQAGGFQGVLPLSAAIAAGQMLRTEVIAPDDEDFSTGLTRIDDVNGDGIDDWLIGTYILGGEEVLVESNVTYIVFGSGQVPATIDLTSLDDSSGYRIDGPVILGRSENYDGTSSISYAGDINGDGIGDFFFNALADDDALDRSVFVVFGQANGAPATLDGRLLDGSNGFRIDQTLPDTTGFGNVVPGRSDVNGDGLDDLLIAASDAGLGGEGLSGSVYVVFGRAGGFPAVLDVTTLDGSNGFRMDGRGNEQAGSSVSSADFNGDGIDDILIGTTAPVDEEEGFSSDAYVVFGKPGGFDVTFALGDLDGSNGFRIIDSASESVQLSQISRAGDFNGDGIEDLVVADGSSGNVYVIYGRNGGFAPILDLATFDASQGLRLDGGSASEIRAAGDINQDGFADIAFNNAGSPVNVIFGGPNPAAQLVGVNTAADLGG